MSTPRQNTAEPATTNLKVTYLPRRRHLQELFITVTPQNGGDFLALFEAVNRTVSEAGATIVAMEVFGTPATEAEGTKALRRQWPRLDWPVTWVTEGTTATTNLIGVQLHAVKGVTVERIPLNDRIVGSVFDDGFARHCRLGDLRPTDVSLKREQQAQQTFEKMESALRVAKMDFTNVTRTWFFLDHILEWYGAFNKVRQQFFSARKIYDGLIPASTGIGGANPPCAAVVAAAYALQPHDVHTQVQMVTSPLQGEALTYGSSFSRAVEAAMPDHRLLWISGTASIGRNGETVHIGDATRQIEHTMKVVGTILESRGFSWAEVTRAIAYVKNGNDTALFRNYCAVHCLDELPVLITETDICRADLLFEIELDAIKQS